MQINGQLKAKCPPPFLVNILRDPDAMMQLLPAGSELEKSPDGTYKFSVVKSIGPLRLTLPGILTITPTGQGHGQTMTVAASHMIGGKVDMKLRINIFRAEGQTNMTYDGDLDATGLAGRILKEHRTRANGAVKASFFRLKLHAEREFAKKRALAQNATADSPASSD
jgi:carbon monoxide dehydrogenase subunit G